MREHDARPAVEPHWHWDVVAYNGPEIPDPTVTEQRKMHWAVAIRVVGYATEADAIIAARAIVERDHYQLQSAWECAQCGYQAAITASMAKMTKGWL